MTSSISIALCTCNSKHLIEEQLRSYVIQGFRPLELAVCDDRSTNATVSILCRLSVTAPFPALIQVNSERSGVTANFGRAIDVFRGNIVALSDQDDIRHPTKLQKLAATFEANVCALSSAESLLRQFSHRSNTSSGTN